MSFSLSVIKGKTIHEYVHSSMRECVDVVKQAYLAHGERQSVNPPSHFLLFPEKPSSRIIALPAYLGGEFDVSGLKWIASYPENIRKGFPRASAVLVLNSYETGYPFAFLESSIISAARTAGSAVLGAEWLLHGQKRARRLGIVGNGLIARYIYDFFVETGWSLDEVQLFDTVPEEAERFRRQVCRPDKHTRVEVAPDVRSLVTSCDLIVLATVASTPYLKELEWFAHNPVVLNISLRDVSPDIILASHNVVDDVDHVMKANTSPHLAEQRTGKRDFVTGTLAELMTGKCAVDRTRPTVFSPFGLGVLDLAVGKWVYDRAVADGKDLRLDDFFYELTR